jgi:hypothetical protein
LPRTDLVPDLRILQTYESLLKETYAHPGSAAVANDQYQVECVALADHDLNVACQTGICYPSLVTMLNCQSMLWQATVLFHVMHVCTSMY